MRTFKKLILLLLILPLLIFLYQRPPLEAKTIQQIQDEIKQYETELTRLAGQAKTLSNQISQFNAQIRLTSLKIEETQEKVTLLGGRIDQLGASLEALTNAFSSRASETYKMVRLGDSLIFLISAPDLKEAVSRFHYLQRIQEADRDLLVRLQEAQNVYQIEKEDQEDLQKQLEEQKRVLARQREEKANLLQVTKNDERRYQQLLAAAQAELAVALGKGEEVYLRDVSEGEVIGRVIPMASGCSSGQHLHFEVHQNGAILNPNDYLRGLSFSYSYNESQYGYYGTISPHGNWNWPMNEPIEINQAYGSHGFAQQFYPGGVHNGIDLDSTSSTAVKAVKPGKLYGGSYQCGGVYAGTLLYAKVEHRDGVTTWYLHMTPQ